MNSFLPATYLLCSTWAVGRYLGRYRLGSYLGNSGTDLGLIPPNPLSTIMIRQYNSISLTCITPMRIVIGLGP